MKDIKYIIKRVIIGLILGIIFMFLSKYTVLAEQIGTIANINIHDKYQASKTFINGNSVIGPTYVGIETNLCTDCLNNYGKGYFIFSIAYYSNSNYQPIISGVAIKSGSQLYACDIGNMEPYTDSQVQYKMASIKCYVNLGSNGLERIRFTTPYLPANGDIFISLSRYGTFVGSASTNVNVDQQGVINAITSQSQQQIQLQTQTNAKLDTQIQQQQTIIQQQQQQNQNIQNINDSINDDNVDAQDSQITDMQNAISSNDSSGLSGIITAPLRMVNNLTLPCQPINLTIPYMNKPLTIQCMSTSVYPKFNGLAIVGVIVNGFLIYRVIASLYYMVKGFKDPENDKVEVMDL